MFGYKSGDGFGQLLDEDGVGAGSDFGFFSKLHDFLLRLLLELLLVHSAEVEVAVVDAHLGRQVAGRRPLG